MAAPQIESIIFVTIWLVGLLSLLKYLFGGFVDFVALLFHNRVIVVKAGSFIAAIVLTGHFAFLTFRA